VLTLDIEMPNMNGLSFLKRLMRVRPMPVVMLSSHTQEGSDIAFRALAMGAVDFVGKPVAGETTDDDYTQLIVEKIRGAYAARDKIEPLDINRATGDADEVLPMLGNTTVTQSKVIVIGASTGGAEALKDILTAMPEDCPPILIAQHARHLHQSCSPSAWTGCADHGQKPRTKSPPCPATPMSPPAAFTCGGTPRWPRLWHQAVAGRAGQPAPVGRRVFESPRNPPAPMRSASSSPAWARTARAAC
jgi:CheY-like chemotaxis protein